MRQIFLLVCFLTSFVGLFAQEVAPVLENTAPPTLEKIAPPLLKIVTEKVEELQLSDAELIGILTDIINDERRDPVWKRYAKKVLKYSKKGAVFSVRVFVTVFLYFVAKDLYEYIVDRVPVDKEDDGMAGTTPD